MHADIRDRLLTIARNMTRNTPGGMPRNGHGRDNGSVLVVALVVTLLGSTMVSALTSFNIVMVRAQATRERRLELERRADAALTTALSDVRIRFLDLGTSCVPESLDVDTVRVDVSCPNPGAESPAPRPGLVTTLNSSTIDAQTLPIWSGGATVAVDGAIAINTGTQSSPSVSYLEDRRTDPTATWSTRPVAWPSITADDLIAGAQQQTPLPPLPLYERPGAQAILGSCNIYFPGRYLGTSSLVLSGGHHYFTSGVYYFERPLAIGNGARVVMGDGSTTGCATDNEAVTATRSPLRHSISGRGTALLFGGAGRLLVQDASLVINARNDGRDPAIRTISFGIATSTIDVPADVVRLADSTTTPASAHSVVPPESSTSVSYKASTLSPTSSLAVSVNLNNAQPETNRFIVAGRILVPHGGVHLASSKSAYRIAITGGIVTTRLTTALTNPPTGAGSGFEIGYQPISSSDAPRMVSIEALAVDGDRSFTSRAEFDVSDSQWSLIGRTRRHRHAPDS